MTMQTKQEILEALTLPPEEYRAALQPEARRVRDEAKGRRIAVSAMLGYDNICRNRCLYCGMRAGSRLERYRYTPDQVLDLCRQAREMGLDRLFLISGEDPKFPFEGLLRMVEGARGMGFSHISLACGEFDRGRYGELKAAGADEYVLKFEMSHRDTFQRLNPSADYDRRMAAMGWIKEAGMALASGNSILPLFYYSFKAPVITLWMRFCQLYGIDALYNNTQTLYGYLARRDGAGAAQWIDTYLEKAISGGQQIYKDPAPAGPEEEPWGQRA